MEVKAFNEAFDHCKKKKKKKKTLQSNTFCRTAFWRPSFSRISLDACFYKIKDNLVQQIANDVLFLRDL